MHKRKTKNFFFSFFFQMAIIIITTTINFSLGGETACLCQNLEPFGYELVEHPSLQLD